MAAGGDGAEMTGWWYTATPQECSGCGGMDRMVNALTKRCLPCDGVILPLAPLGPTPPPAVKTSDLRPALVAER
jgi:hypothetical protein